MNTTEVFCMFFASVLVVGNAVAEGEKSERAYPEKRINNAGKTEAELQKELFGTKMPAKHPDKGNAYDFYFRKNGQAPHEPLTDGNELAAAQQMIAAQKRLIDALEKRVHELEAKIAELESYKAPGSGRQPITK
jgi:hypothetical protein